VGLDGLLERDEVVASVDQLVADVADGRSTALYVLGEAGLGKTSVLDYARERAAAAGLTVGFGRGHPMETGLPFGLLAQAADVVGAGALLGGDQGPAASSSDRAATFFRVLRWLRDRTASPLLLAFDDVHWADADSLALLSFLSRRLGLLRVGILLTLRPWPSEAHRTVMALADEGCGAVSRLGPLSEPAAAALLADRIGHPLPGVDQQRAYSLCAGNPLLLEQLAVALAHGEGMSALASTERRAFGQDLLLARFAGLPSAGMRCAQAAAVLGTNFLAAVAAEVAGLEGRDVDIALDALGQSGLIEQGAGAAVEFAHPLFRQALYDDLTGPARTRLHGRAFAALHARGMDARAAEHVMPAHLAGDPDAVAVLERAGLAARRSGAFAAAVTHLNAAVAMAGDRATVGLRLAHAEALLVGGHLDRALAAYVGLLSRADCSGADRVQALWMLGRARAMAGQHGQAAGLFDQAAETARPRQPEVAVAVLLDATFSAWLSQGPGSALGSASRAREIARSAGREVQIAADAGWGEVAIQAGDPAGITAVESSAPWDVTGRASSPEIAPGAWGSVSSFAFACALTERLEESDRAFAVLRQSADRSSAPEPMAALANGHGYTLMRMGRLAEALAAIEAALALVELSPIVDSFAAVGKAYIQLYMGRLAESARWFDRVENFATSRGEWNALLFLWDGRGHRLLREGRAAEASENYARLEATRTRMGIGEPCLPAWGRHAIAAYLAAGRIEDAERVISWLDQTRMPCRFPRIAASTGKAQLAELAGDESAAQSHFDAALALHGEVDLPLELAETLLAYGGFLRRSGRATQARSVLAQAGDVATAAGAGWLAGLAGAELKVAGGRQRARTRGTLSPQEQRVARLAANGAANAEIARQLYVSVSTVETHLEHIYAKLGIHSRYELIARVSELGVDP
jgi:DNA-binding CsgD family transcriptional regulator